MNKKKFLVTGGAGFIGSHTVSALIERGDEVAIVDNLITGKRENIHPRASFYEMNITDPRLEEVFEKEKPDYIYHFAFNVMVPESVENPLIDMDSISGSVNLFNNVRKYGIKKVVFSSSGFVYGNTDKLPTKEDTPIQPISSYVVSKQAVENYLDFFYRAYRLPYVVLRYGTVYGPGQVRGAMSDYIRKLVAGEQAVIWGDGLKSRDYVYIDDITNANLLAMDTEEKPSNMMFNVGSGKETTLNEVYQLIADLLGKYAQPVYLPDRSGELMRNCLDSNKFQSVSNWTPQYLFKDGLKLRLKAEGLI
ncbi:MAG: NAD-dependent epimerase/dehydratase family protein [bacterium]